LRRLQKMKLIKKNLPLEDTLQDFLIPQTNRLHKDISAVLQYLMNDLNMSEGELYRRTGVPQPSIHRILTGKTPKPRSENVKKIADFFGITEDQLLAREPLANDRVMGSLGEKPPVNMTVPILNWDEIEEWIDQGTVNFSKTILVYRELSPRSFAVIINQYFETLQFRLGTILIIDTRKLPRPGDYAILSCHGNIIFGELILEKTGYELISERHDERIKIQNDYKFLGVLIESRRSFE